jgi:uncharacterized membrane protein HdeD (DUF308 family)
MHDDDEFSAGQFPAAMIAASGWQATLFIGAVTLILGIIVTAHPSGSLNVIAVLLGVLAIVSGIFHLIRAFGRTERSRTWQAISGLVFIVVGVLLIRHLDLTVAAIGLLIGITWIVQGVAALIGAFAGVGVIRGWWAVFGLVSLIAGIVVTASPVTSVTVLAVLIGIWFIIIGLFQMILALILRHALSSGQGRGQVQGRDRGQDQGQVPGQRPGSAQESAPGETSPRSADRGASSQ